MIPKITSQWTRVIEYSDNHLNDFCLFKALDKRWHCIGIMGTGTWESETSLFHCSSPALHGPYEIHEPLLADMRQGPTANDAPQKHAPFVVIRGNTYYLFFRRPQGTNLLLKSSDLFDWPIEPEVVFEENDARDACIQNFEGVYHWYYCQWRTVESVGRSCILLRRSEDLGNWSEAVVVHIDTSREVTHSHLESPSVVCIDGCYWLFVCDLSQKYEQITTVFRSRSPESFPSGKKAWDGRLFNVHAAELVECDGKWYIARVSGPPKSQPYAAQQGGWIDLAELSFTNEE